MDFNIFTELYNHYHHLVSEHFQSPTEKLHTHEHSLPIPNSHGPQQSKLVCTESVTLGCTMRSIISFLVGLPKFPDKLYHLSFKNQAQRSLFFFFFFIKSFTTRSSIPGSQVLSSVVLKHLLYTLITYHVPLIITLFPPLYLKNQNLIHFCISYIEYGDFQNV